MKHILYGMIAMTAIVVVSMWHPKPELGIVLGWYPDITLARDIELQFQIDVVDAKTEPHSAWIAACGADFHLGGPQNDLSSKIMDYLWDHTIDPYFVGLATANDCAAIGKWMSQVEPYREVKWPGRGNP